MIFYTKYLRTFIEQNTCISNHLNDIMRTPSQEKVYHSLDVNFFMSDSFASRTEMDIIGNCILRFLILGSKTVKTVKTGLLTYLIPLFIAPVAHVRMISYRFHLHNRSIAPYDITTLD